MQCRNEHKKRKIGNKKNSNIVVMKNIKTNFATEVFYK